MSDLGSQDFLARILMHVPAQSLHSGGSTPPEELLGEMLLEMGRPLEAQASFLAGNQRWPNRLDTLLGLARASALEGDDDEAEERYRRVLEQLACADPGHPAKAEAARAVGL